MLSWIPLLAQAGGSGAKPGGGGGGGMAMLLPLVLMMVVFFFIMRRGTRSQEKKREAMINAMSKNDRVMTIGGIVGRVVSVKDNEVVLKVDEASNTKMTFIKRSIQQVISDEDDLSQANRKNR